MNQHPEFQIIMVRSPHLTQEEIDRRLRQAFDLTLDFDIEEPAAPQVSQATGAAADITPGQKPEQSGVQPK